MAHLKIISQSSINNGIRRLELLTGQQAYNYINNKIPTLDKICRESQTTPDNIVNKINSIKDEVKLLKKKNLLYSKDYLTNLFKSFNKVTLKEDIVYYIESIDNLDTTEFRMLSDIIKSKNNKSLSFLIDP